MEEEKDKGRGGKLRERNEKEMTREGLSGEQERGRLEKGRGALKNTKPGLGSGWLRLTKVIWKGSWMNRVGAPLWADKILEVL